VVRARDTPPRHRENRRLVTVTELAEAKGDLAMRIERLGSELRAELEIAVTAIRAELGSTAAAIRAELKAEIQATAATTRSDMLRHMYTAMGAQMALLLGIAYFFSLHVK
jgi:hypothetical protein